MPGLFGMVFSMFSSAKIGPPALTKPITGIPDDWFDKVIPRDVPAAKSRTPFFFKAFKWSSAALGDLNPKVLEISDRVGG